MATKRPGSDRDPPAYLTSPENDSGLGKPAPLMERGEQDRQSFMGGITHLISQMPQECRQISDDDKQRFSAQAVKSFRANTPVEVLGNVLSAVLLFMREIRLFNALIGTAALSSGSITIILTGCGQP